MSRLATQLFFAYFFICIGLLYAFTDGNEQSVSLFVGGIILLALGDLNK